MTHFAPVSPLSGLRELAKTRLLGTYQLLIAPIVLREEEPYRVFFHKHDDQQIIMDNGVIELGHSVSPRALAEAAKVVGASVVVMPDTIDDLKMTMKQVRYALAAFRHYDNRTETMGVVQGLTMEECLECAKSHVEAGVDRLAVPRGLTKNLGSRIRLVELLASEYGLPMHVLGFSDNLLDDVSAATAHRAVRGIDAATPMWTKEWLPLHPPADPNASLALGKRPKEFWTQPVSERAGHNVETVRRWLRESNAARDALTSRGGLADRVDPLTQT